MESRKRALSPDGDAAAAETRRYSHDAEQALPQFAPAPPSTQHQLPPLSSLTTTLGSGGDALPQLPRNGSINGQGNKRPRLDDSYTGSDRRASLHTMHGLSGSGGLGPAAPYSPYNAGSARTASSLSAPVDMDPLARRHSSATEHTQSYSRLPFVFPANSDSPAGRFSPGDASRFSTLAVPHSQIGLPGTPSAISPSASANLANRVALFSANSPVSKVPKPPATYLFNRDQKISELESNTSTHPSPPSNTALNTTSLSSLSPFSSGAFGIPPYGANFHAPSLKRLDSNGRDSHAVLSKLPSMSEEHLRRPSDTDEGSQRSRGEGHSNNKGRTYAEYAENDVDAEEAELEGKVLPLLSAKRKGGAGGTPGKSRKTEIGRINEEFKRRKKAVNVAVVNDERLTRIPRNVEERYLGHVNYTGPRLRRPGSEDVHDIELFLLPKFTIDHHYATIEVRVPAFFLSCKRNVAARLSAVWGTDIYADDSDMVAMLIHSGWYRPFDSTGVNYTGAAFPNAVDIVPPKVEPGKTEGELVEAQLSPSTATKIPDQLKDGAKAADVRLIPPAVVTPIVGKADPKDGLADHDIFVTLRVLPRLVKYAGSLRNGVESRGWGSAHDGESVRIEKVVAVEKGMVSKHGRKSAAKQWSAMAKVIGKTKPGSKEADGSALHAGWGEAEPAKGAGPVTVVFSDDGEACIKYGQRFLLDWPPYLRAKCEKAAVKKVIGKETPAEPTKPSDPAVITYIDTFEDSELLNAQKWPYWRLGLSKGSLIMEDGKRHRYELALAEVHSSNPPPTEKAFSETSTRSEPRYRLARRNSRLNPLRRSSLERKQAREPRAVDAPDIIASALKAEDIDWTDKGLALASGETVNVARFFWMTNSKPATKSAQDADVKGLGIKPAEEKQPS